jgi:hypothetical protein
MVLGLCCDRCRRGPFQYLVADIREDHHRATKEAFVGL